MASTITASALTVTITESITLNGSSQGGTNTLSIAGVDEVYKRIITCPANSETRIVDFHSSVADAILTPLDVQDVVYIRVTKLDDTNSLTLSLQIDVGEDDSAADESASLLIEAGKSFIMGVPNDGIGSSGTGDTGANLVTDLVDLESLVVFTGGAAIDVEVFIASV